MLWTRRLLVCLPWAVLLYLIRFRIGPLPTTGLELFLLVLMGVFTWETRGRGWQEGVLRLSKWRKPVVAWILVTSLAVIVAPQYVVAFGLWRAYILEPLLVFVMLWAVDDGKLRKQMLWSLGGTVLLVTGWSVVQFLTGWGIPKPWNVSIVAGRRATGPFPFPNAIALFVVPITALFVALLVSARSSLVRVLAFVVSLSGLVAVLVAKSDGGLVALLIVSWITMCVHRRTRVLAGLLLLIACVGLVLLPTVRTKIVHEVTLQNWSGKVRVYMWHDTTRMLTDYPLFGAGFGGYPTVFRSYQSTKGIEVFQYPHNVLLNLWSETGILGVMVFAWICVTWLQDRYRADVDWSERLVFWNPLVAMMIHGLVDVPYFKNDLALIFWVLAYLSSASDTSLYSPRQGGS